nr:DNA glycosylase [Tanacetum cinerariifolium]
MVIADSLDYEALKRAHVNEISDAIWERGMNNLLADRMKGSLEYIPRIDTSKSNTYALNAKVRRTCHLCAALNKDLVKITLTQQVRRTIIVVRHTSHMM